VAQESSIKSVQWFQLGRLCPGDLGLAEESLVMLALQRESSLTFAWQKTVK
jgi:hypothetical protein